MAIDGTTCQGTLCYFFLSHEYPRFIFCVISHLSKNQDTKPNLGINLEIPHQQAPLLCTFVLIKT